MRIVVNGLAKSGTHALLKAVYLNRPKIAPWGVEHGHFPSPQVDVDRNKHLLILRHPRNVLLSNARSGNDAPSESLLLSMMEHYSNAGNFTATAIEYAPYLTDGKTHVIHYEDLISNPATIRGVCAFIGYEYVEGTFEFLPTAWTATNRVRHSRWEDFWTPTIDSAWAQHGLAWERHIGY